MGLLYIVHRLNPENVAQVRSEFQRSPDLTWEGAKKLFARAGRRGPPDGAHSSWDDYQEMFEFEGWNLVLTLAASEASWDLDKSLDRPGDGLPAIAKLMPALAPIARVLAAMESFAGADLPKQFEPAEMGLMGIATDDCVRDAHDAAATYSRPDARASIAAAPVPWLKRLLGGGVTLSSWREDDYLWDNWCRLLDAIQQAASRRHWLGLEMR